MANNPCIGSTKEPKELKSSIYSIPPIGSTYTIAKPPKPVGWWVLGHGGYGTTQFAIYVKPTDDQIYNTEQLLGWKWKDA